MVGCVASAALTVAYSRTFDEGVSGRAICLVVEAETEQLLL